MDDSTASAPTVTVVVMGVSGTGKTTAGTALAAIGNWPFAEGDRFHPPRNVAKMSEGIPLDDEDRWPWLRSIAEWIGEQEAAGRDAVVACSALKRSYRDLLREGHPSVWFAHLTAPEEVLAQRLRNRPGHYMPASLLPSQLATLEPLAEDEPGAVIDDDKPEPEVVAGIVEQLEALTGRPVRRLRASTGQEAAS